MENNTNETSVRTLEVRVGGVVRGKSISGKRPNEIKVIFTQAIIEDIFRTQEKTDRFLKWLQCAIYPALDS